VTALLIVAAIVVLTLGTLALIGFHELRREQQQRDASEADLRHAEHQLFHLTAGAFRAMFDEARRSGR
jgi:hypothetical protein